MTARGFDWSFDETLKKGRQSERSDRFIIKDVSNPLTMSHFDTLRALRHKAYSLMGNRDGMASMAVPPDCCRLPTVPDRENC